MVSSVALTVGVAAQSARPPSMGAGCQLGDAGMRLNVEALLSYVDHTRSRLVLIIYNEMGKH